MKETWIVICYTSEGGIGVAKMFGTREEVQEKLFSFIKKDRDEDKDGWYSGTESVYDFDSFSNGFCGYNNFEQYSINYAAYVYNDLPRWR